MHHRLCTSYRLGGLNIGACIRRRFYGCTVNETAVYSFGDGSNGATGIPLSCGADVYEPMRIPCLPKNISSISAGHYHSLAVTDDGEIWAWGRNDEGQLGRGHDAPRHSWNVPKRVEGLEQVNVKAAFASGVVSVAIGGEGSLWIWGKSKRGQLGLGEGVTVAMVPCQVEALAGEEIVKVSLGWGHALARTRDGKLFGWGYAAEGRLGQLGKTLQAPISPEKGCSIYPYSELAAEKQVLKQMEEENKMPIVWVPTILLETVCHEVVDMACGLDHSLVLCCDKTLLSGGDNVYGQLGRTAQGLNLLPVQIAWPVMSISSSLGHSLAVCHPGEGVTKVASWGWNCCSQLGREGVTFIPGLVEGLDGEVPISVTCGRVHSLVLTANKEIWAWGSGRNGRLGSGSTEDEARPTRVEALDGLEVLKIASGFDHNLVLVMAG